MSSHAARDPYTTRFEATVASRDGREVVLDSTYFYPEGGGQPADRGTIAGARVVDVQQRDGEVVHTLAEDDAGAVEQGATVEGVVDEAFRTYCMRAHTASHVLYGAGRRLLSDLGYGGFGITEGKVRVDFSTTTDIDDGTLVDLERLVNRAVWESRPVTWEERPREEALSDEAVAFNTKTEEGIAGDTVRIVTVGRGNGNEVWDAAACGGTHVSNTRELGPVTVLGRSNPGEGLTRVEFGVGEAGIERRAAEKRAALDAARTLGTNVTDLPAEADRLREERDALAADRADLRERLVDVRIADLREETVERDGRTWLVGDVEGLDANGLADRAQALVGDGVDVAALVNGSSLAVATGGDPEAGDVVDAVTDEFGGGGGGSPTVAQGGGLGAENETVVAFLRGE
ncbi:alanyl-tRNA editing protein [Halomarina ordinaria]|uniref:Alanyl-tRNA editing protein n=1 Tax=Halomarina ordinaria TaxID=3033939 RepID=A0ABD5U4V8_9EURY|nr:alanine--tRNA ligase-related protein [Halomarina sp. PSRA2]